MAPFYTSPLRPPIEAQGLFQGISQALGQEIRAVKQKKLSPPLENAFSRFCEVIFTVAQAHFHSHICGSGPPPTLYPKASWEAHCEPPTPTTHPTDSICAPESLSRPSSVQAPANTDITMQQEEAPAGPSDTTPTSPASSALQTLHVFHAANSPVPSAKTITPRIQRSHSTPPTTTAPFIQQKWVARTVPL
ncbi:hypothetical protein V496_00070 [Pseudogymnoascus sp. VKM F-4515 (FW-2607)]|nr:hypothetical protein V496_00070 [Pseudogymnoascus sp. VKM F-4515 (FW-2607)]